MKKTIEDLRIKKKNRVPITMLTAYDFPTALAEDTAGIDAILVGDSVGTNVLGYASECEVTMADMLHHTAAVCRAVQKAFVLADLPYRAAENVEDALANTRKLLEKGAQCVKIEGWQEISPIIEALAGHDITVCGHIGYNPQIHGPRPKVFGKNAEEAQVLRESARVLQEAGAQLIIAEKVAQDVAGSIAFDLAIPVIGIGSGNRCDGQVLVINDLLGITQRRFRHARRYAEAHQTMVSAIEAYAADVETRRFPGPEHESGMSPPA
ncbi:MAG: 3-methyl-2-oxobutanoate hydroxymethyltransferase [Chitinispirillaceae bacterium]|nr:3-methyl-2-oxobutanoate hydroxymethyltransferase [Chitinispirillaceae bacterium]